MYKLTHLKELESESIYVLREVAAQYERPAILFSGGKDSIVVTYLAYKAFYPAKIPFPLVHIDTGHNFQETLDYRDALVKKNWSSTYCWFRAGKYRYRTRKRGKRLQCQSQSSSNHNVIGHNREIQIRCMHRRSTA